MQLRNIVLLAAAAANVQAAPVVTQNIDNLVPVHARIINKGVLTYLADPAGKPVDFDFDDAWNNPADFVTPPTSLQRRCGSNQVHCSDTNLARSSVCEDLINVLRGNPGAGIPISAGALRWTVGSFSCIIAWDNAVANMVQGYLIGAAEATLGRCGPGGTVSGWATDVSLNNVCTVQKLYA